MIDPIEKLTDAQPSGVFPYAIGEQIELTDLLKFKRFEQQLPQFLEKGSDQAIRNGLQNDGITALFERSLLLPNGKKFHGSIRNISLTRIDNPLEVLEASPVHLLNTRGNVFKQKSGIFTAMIEAAQQMQTEGQTPVLGFNFIGSAYTTRFGKLGHVETTVAYLSGDIIEHPRDYQYGEQILRILSKPRLDNRAPVIFLD